LEKNSPRFQTGVLGGTQKTPPFGKTKNPPIRREGPTPFFLQKKPPWGEEFSNIPQKKPPKTTPWGETLGV